MEKIPGASKYFWVGNRTVLNFTNTDIFHDGRCTDLLEDSVAGWMREAGIVFSGDTPADLIDEARSYRAELRKGVARIIGGSRLPAALLDATNGYLARDATRLRLEQEEAGYVLGKRFEPKTAADFMAPIAESFARMLTEDDLSRLRKCANPECVLYFYDVSKGGKRRWCSLDICGNKLRMAASRRRHA